MLQQQAIVIFKKLYIRLEHSIRVQKLPSMTFATSSLVHQCDLLLAMHPTFLNIEHCYNGYTISLYFLYKFSYLTDFFFDSEVPYIMVSMYCWSIIGLIFYIMNTLYHVIKHTPGSGNKVYSHIIILQK